jgi:hypothetical protein
MGRGGFEEVADHFMVVEALLAGRLWRRFLLVVSEA